MSISRFVGVLAVVLGASSAFAQSLAVAPAAPRVGQLATITQTFASAPGANVSFFSNGLAIAGCQSVAPSGNTAVCTTKFDDAVAVNLTTSPAGGQLVGFTPRKASATITLTVPANIVAGQAVNLVTTVAGLDGIAAPTGTVSFKDGNSDLAGPVNVSNGTASLTTSAIQSGARVLWAAYSGDSRYDSGFAVGTTTAGDDTTPNPISFTAVSGVAPGAVQTSNSQTISGISVPVSITVSGGAYSIGCTGAFTTAPGNISNGQSVCVQHVSSCSPGTPVSTTLQVGSGVSATFTSTTGATGCPVGDEDGDGIPSSEEPNNQPPTSASVKDNNVFAGTTASNRLFLLQMDRDFRGTAPATDMGLLAALEDGSQSKQSVLSSMATSYAAVGLQVFRLYQAGIGRRPDISGFDFWRSSIAGGTQTIDGMAAFIVSSAPEFVQRYGNLDNTQFITQLYRNVYKRDPDAGGLAFWVDEINSGRRTRASVLIAFSGAPEYTTTLNGDADGTTFSLYRAMLRRVPADPTEYQANLGLTAAQLAERIYNSSEYASRLLGAAPARCDSTFSLSAASLDVNPATAGGVASFNIARTGNVAQACAVEVIACTATTCGTTAVQGTNYALTNASTPFTGGRYVANFGTNVSAATVNITIPAAAATAPGGTLKLFLRNAPWGASYGTDAISINIAGSGGGGGGGCDREDGGSCIPDAKTRAEFSSSDPKFFDRCYSDGSGPCGGYSINNRRPAGFPANVQLFQHNWAMPNQVSVSGVVPDNQDWGALRQFFMSPGQALAFRVRTPAEGVLKPLNVTDYGGGIIITTYRSLAVDEYGTSAITRFVSISETPGDFDIAKWRAGDPCYRSASKTDIQWNITSGAVEAGVCKLKPNTTYYINIRNENAADGTRADSCSGTCGILLKLGAGL